METHTMETSSGMTRMRGWDESVLRRCVEKIENGTLTTPNNISVLHLAAACGTADQCGFLIKTLKFDINRIDDKGRLRFSSWRMVQMLHGVLLMVIHLCILQLIEGPRRLLSS